MAKKTSKNGREKNANEAEVQPTAFRSGLSKDGEIKQMTRPHSTKTRSVSLPLASQNPRPISKNSKKRANSIPAVLDSRQRESPSPTPSQRISSLIPLIKVKPKLSKRFYEALVLCNTLGRNRGDHTADEEFEPDVPFSEVELSKCRRRYLKDLAYLCDYEKGGDTVTAIMLEKAAHDSRGIVYWFAVNKDTKGETLQFLKKKILNPLGDSKLPLGDEVENRIFTHSVDFNQKRIGEYVKQLKNCMVKVSKHLEKSDLDEDTRLLKWLREIESKASSFEEICRLSYESRNSECFKGISRHTNGESQLAKDFRKVRHIIGRLGHTVKAVKSVIAARIRLPNLFMNFEVSQVASSKSTSPPLGERFGNKPPLEAMVGRLVVDRGDTSGPALMKNALRRLDTDNKLSEKLKEQCISSTWKPKVHAELLLLDFAWNNDIEFVDNDKYIAASKSACYCCSLYISEHPGNFVPPACHNNLWLNWRSPDFCDTKKGEFLQVQEKILNKMTEIIREKVLDQIYLQQTPRANKPDSLTVISSLIPPVLNNHLNCSDESDPEVESESVAVDSGDSRAESPVDSVTDEDDDVSDDDEGGVSLSGLTI